MRLQDFSFTLPPDLIAQRPCVPRDAARLLYVPKNGAAVDSQVRHLPDFLQAGDVLVFNQSRVLPVALSAFCGQRHYDLLLHGLQGDTAWALTKPLKTIRVGDVLQLPAGVTATVLEKVSGQGVRLRFSLPPAALGAWLEVHGRMPLPPYLGRQADAQDNADYQTIFARDAGSVAAPTAGLHFMPRLLQALQDKGVILAYLTLHVGLGTFLPIKVSDITTHQMHAEYYAVSDKTAQMINQAKKAGGRVIAVGTTALRTLETVAADNGTVTAKFGETKLFIYPSYRFKTVDWLMTNFHLPESTLLLLLGAFAGRKKVLSLYQHAIAKRYHFFSYGDSSLWERNDDHTAG